MPIAYQPVNLVVCDDSTNDGYETFNLSSQNTVILGGQSTTDFNVSYNRTLNDAQNGINALPLNYPNIQNPETIYVRVENKQSTLCYAMISFQLIVRSHSQLNMADVYSICEETSITI